MGAAETSSNETPVPFADELRAAMESFGRDPANLDPFIDCTRRVQFVRKKFAQEIISICNLSSPFKSGAKALTMIGTLRESIDEVTSSPYEVEAHQRMQVGMDKGIADITALLEEMQDITSTGKAYRTVFNPFAGDARAFIDAARQVMAVAPLPAPLAGLDHTVRDIEENLRRFEVLLATQDRQERDMKNVIASSGDFILRLAKIKGASAEYVQQLEEAIASCTEGVPAPVSIRKPLALRKLSAV